MKEGREGGRHPGRRKGKERKEAARESKILEFRWIFSVIVLVKDIAEQGEDHTKAKGFVAKTEDGQERLSFNVNGTVFQPFDEMDCYSATTPTKAPLNKFSCKLSNRALKYHIHRVLERC